MLIIRENYKIDVGNNKKEEVSPRRLKGLSITLKNIESKEQAQNAPAPFTTNSFFNNGKFVTNEIFAESKFAKYIEEIGV